MDSNPYWPLFVKRLTRVIRIKTHVNIGKGTDRLIRISENRGIKEEVGCECGRVQYKAEGQQYDTYPD